MAPLRNAQRLGLLVLGASVVSAGVQFDICADFNTADSNPRVSIYQTNGLCFDTCKQNYAYAITQYQSCWCSNYAPDKGSQVSRGRCNTPCPAYPEEERCGGDGGIFAYIALANEPSGTRGPSSPSTSKPQSSKSTDEAMTTTATTRVTETVQTTVTRVTTSAPLVTKSSSSPKTSTSSDETSTPPAILTTSYVQTVTVGGTIKTVTVAPAYTPTTSGTSTNEDPANTSNTKTDSGLGTGAVVGIAVGVVAGVLIVAAAAVFWFFRRRKQSQEDGYQEDPSVRGTSPGTVGTAGGPEMMMGGGPISATNTTGNRSSILQIDPRMDPFKGQGLYPRAGSHESLNTIRDDQDYSRRIQHPLRATNPDPDVTQEMP